MTKTALAFLLLGTLIVVGGVALFDPRVATILAGLLLIATGVLSLERPTREEQPR